MTDKILIYVLIYFLQDGYGQGTVTEYPTTSVGWVRVAWDAGDANSYRMGAQGAYDLQIVC